MVRAAIERTARRTTVHFAMVVTGLAITVGESVREMFESTVPPPYVPKRESKWDRQVARLLRWINDGVDAIVSTVQTGLGPRARKHTRQHQRLRLMARGTQEHQGFRHRLIVWWCLAQWAPYSLWPRRGRTRGLAGSLAMASIIVMAHQGQRERSALRAQFDTDSTRIGIDNRCTACIADESKFFVGALRPVTRTIKGFGGSQTSDIMMGTIKWKWLDDEGVEHTFLIPDSFYIPKGQVNLLSPQHWAQTMKEGKAWETTDKSTCTLFWKGGKHQLTVPLGKGDNVATIDLAPGYSRYASFCAYAAIGDCNDDRAPVEAMAATTVDFDDGIEDADGHALEDHGENSLAQEREEENREEEGEDGADQQSGNSTEEEKEGITKASIPSSMAGILALSKVP